MQQKSIYIVPYWGYPLNKFHHNRRTLTYEYRRNKLSKTVNTFTQAAFCYSYHIYYTTIHFSIWHAILLWHQHKSPDQNQRHASWVSGQMRLDDSGSQSQLRVGQREELPSKLIFIWRTRHARHVRAKTERERESTREWGDSFSCSCSHKLDPKSQTESVVTRLTERREREKQRETEAETEEIEKATKTANPTCALPSPRHHRA